MEESLRRGGPLCPPARCDVWMVDRFEVPGVDDFGVALARWMHRVCAEVAGCYAKSDNHPVRLGLSVPFSG